ncbi:MAG: substrate-binding domain-containing protein [Alphaproteobacteria bacterium]
MARARADKLPVVGPEAGEAPSGRKPVGLRQVAKVAGVSTATVSRAINAPASVSPELKTRIDMVIRELGWVPSGAARALATRRTGTIGAVFPALAQGDFARAIDALQDELALRDYTLLLARSRYSTEEELKQVLKLVERGVDGLVLVGRNRHPDLDLVLQKQKVPVVNTFVYQAEGDVPFVGPDNRAALFKMTEYLVGLGHRRFAMIAQSTLNNDRAAARREGVQAALAEHGIAIPPAHLVEGRWTINEGRRLFRQILERRPWPTAVIGGNSQLAVGAVLESQAMGIRLPKDMSIVGYDDIEIMRELPVPITTVRVASDDVGREAARVVVGLVEGKQPVGSVELPSEIIIRQSSGKPPQDG